MRTRLPSVLFLILWSGVGPVLGQLPPEILADSHLLRAEQAIRDGDKDRARAEIDKIILLQKEHELDLAEEFHFRLATVAGAAALPEQALEFVTKYLAAAGRGGPNYVEALELMNQAQDAIERQKELRVASAGSSPQAQEAALVPIDAREGGEAPPEVQTEPQDLVHTGEEAGPKSAPACDLPAWNTGRYFKTATIQDVKACIEVGADPMARTKHKDTPLHRAARYNANPAVTETLLAAGADVNARDWYKDTPLHRAARYNAIPAVTEALLAAGADTTARNQGKTTPLHWAAGSNEHPAVTEALLKAGADVEARDENKTTPLHWAVDSNGNVAVVEALLAAVTDLNVFAVDKKQLRREGPILSVNDCRLWHTLVFFRMATVPDVNACLAAGADPNARNKNKATPLHRTAAFNGNPAVIETLLAAGADLNARGKNKWTALHSAAMSNGNPAVIETLLAAGADPVIRARWKTTPLHLAARYNGNPAVIEALVAAGVDLNARNSDKETPLHLAADFNEHPAVVEVLVKAGADLRAQDEDDRTPLQRARPAVRQVLLAAGAGQIQRRLEAARARRKAKSGPGFLESAIGIVGGTAIAAAGGGSEEALATGTVFAEGVIRGQSPAEITAAAAAVGSAGNVGAGTSGPCEIPGYPRPANVQNLGLSWCPSTVDFQARVFALQAAGAQCAIAIGSSSTPEQIQARRQEIQAGCTRLEALGVPNCRCPSFGVLDGPGDSEVSSSFPSGKP